MLKEIKEYWQTHGGEYTLRRGLDKTVQRLFGVEDRAWRRQQPPEAELDRVALMDVAAVLPEHRGHGLERRMLLWAEEQLPARFDRLMCTVSPANPASLHSIERSGYRAVLTKEKYGGHLRHIMLKER